MPILGVVASSKLGKPTVTGGTLSSDATYHYRTFLSNGSLVVSGGPINYESITVAGGGVGNYYGAGAGGAGGAGGFLSASGSLSSNTYSIVVGGGGAANVDVAASGNGTNSTFNTSTAIGDRKSVV
jgi:hypothetical protein